MSSAFDVAKNGFSNGFGDSGVTAKQTMQFQEYMSNTAHQREMEDLRRAGLNPILSAGGSGATTPAGSQDSADTLELLSGLVGAVQTSAKAVSGASRSVYQAYKSIEEGSVPSASLAVYNPFARYNEYSGNEYHEGLSPTGWLPDAPEQKIGAFGEAIANAVEDTVGLFLPASKAKEVKRVVRKYIQAPKNVASFIRYTGELLRGDHYGSKYESSRGYSGRSGWF